MGNSSSMCWMYFGARFNTKGVFIGFHCHKPQHPAMTHHSFSHRSPGYRLVQPMRGGVTRGHPLGDSGLWHTLFV